MKYYHASPDRITDFDSWATDEEVLKRTEHFGREIEMLRNHPCHGKYKRSIEFPRRQN